MRKPTIRLLLAAALATGFQLSALPAVAAPCGGFIDVDDTVVSSDFCQSVEWIKNRGVTLGCGTGLYCPDNAVNRLQMAAFMKRLGGVLSPAPTLLEASPGAIDLDVLPTPRICITPEIDPPPVPPATDPGKPYPRRAFIHTTFSGQAAGALQYRTDLQFSSDNGASWDFVWPNYANRDGTTGAHWVSSSQSGSVDLDANLTYRFSILVRREGVGTTADFSDSRCFVTVAVYSRTGSSTPFDPNPIKPAGADH